MEKIIKYVLQNRTLILNYLTFIISVVSALISFKIISTYANIEVLSQYFKYRALGGVFVAILAIRTSDLIFSLRVKYRLNIHRAYCIVNMVLMSYLLIVLLILPVVVIDKVLLIFPVVFNFLFISLYESYIHINRIFDKYNRIVIMRIVFLIKPAMLVAIALKWPMFFDSVYSIFYIEFLFVLLYLLCFQGKNLLKLNRRSLKFTFRIIFINKKVIVSNWTQSIYKIPLESFPNYYLSFFTESYQYVYYFIARKVYQHFMMGLNPFFQIQDAYASNTSIKTITFVKRYYLSAFVIILVPFITANIFIELIIEFISNKSYVTNEVVLFARILLAAGAIYGCFYPVKSLIFRNNMFKKFTTITVISSGVLLCVALIFIPQKGPLAVLVIAAVGPILPYATIGIIHVLSRMHYRTNKIRKAHQQ